MKSTASTISEYNLLQITDNKAICTFLQNTIDTNLKNNESKIWHGTPVWFLDGNPIVSYSVRKNESVCLMFFSGQSFAEDNLVPEGKFKAAEIHYTNISQVKITQLKRWLKKAKSIQWDYKNLVKRQGVLVKL